MFFLTTGTCFVSSSMAFFTVHCTKKNKEHLKGRRMQKRTLESTECFAALIQKKQPSVYAALYVPSICSTIVWVSSVILSNCCAVQKTPAAMTESDATDNRVIRNPMHPATPLKRDSGEHSIAPSLEFRDGGFCGMICFNFSRGKKKRSIHCLLFLAKGRRKTTLAAGPPFTHEGTRATPRRS